MKKTCFVTAALLALVASCCARSGSSPVAPAEFAVWPPEQRVAYLEKHGFYSELGDLLVATGTDAVPKLVDVIRHGSSVEAQNALNALCRMDEYVAASEAPLPEFNATIRVPSLQIRGRLNTARAMDGHRVGPAGLGAVQWAARHSSHGSVRLAAQICLGELHTKFSAMAFAELVPLWENLVKRCNHLAPCNAAGEDRATLAVLDQVLAERAPESLDALAEMLRPRQNGFLIIEAQAVLGMADQYRVRAGRDESGKKLIRVISAKLDPSNSERLFPVGFLQIGFSQEHEMRWRQERQAALDELSTLAPRFIPSIVAFAAYAHLQGTLNPVWETNPELRAFVEYLSNSHPDFPSWEYTATSPEEEILHPQFEIKMRRFLEEWRKFKESRKTP